IFLLYTTLRGAPIELVGPDGFRGLGHIDSRQDTLTIDITLRRPLAEDALTEKQSSKGQPQSGKKGRRLEEEEIVKTFTLAQDKTALRSRSGDTGSVLWRASVELARVILQQNAFLSTNSLPLFNGATLANTHVLELGCVPTGTGLLGAALSPLVRTYTLTDVSALLPLLRKNVALNLASTTSDPDSASRSSLNNVVVEPLDWELANHPTTKPSAQRINHHNTSHSSDEQHLHVDADPKYTLVLAIDCIYHPSLLPALVDTLCAATPPGAWALVLAELRAEDVLREFLARWLDGECDGWKIWALRGVVGVHYALWVGLRTMRA
ncbi:hypothetical protein CONPUDRAFT_59850, partial [Coniophora puteana RWD-64-598 SS2]